MIPGFGSLDAVFTEPFLVDWELDGTGARSAELPEVAVPACVHAGVIGVAPSHELMEAQRAREERIREAGGPIADPMPETAFPPLAASGLRTIPPRETGGNIDIRRLVADSTRPAAYCLCSVCVDLHLSEVVDVPYPLVSALIPLDVFERV